RAAHRRDDRVAGLPFQFAATAAQHDPPATVDRVVGHFGVAVGVPVASYVAGAGRDHQRRYAVGRPLRGRPIAGGVRNRQVPAYFGLAQAQWLAETADRIEHVDAGAVGNAPVDE